MKKLSMYALVGCWPWGNPILLAFFLNNDTSMHVSLNLVMFLISTGRKGSKSTRIRLLLWPEMTPIHTNGNLLREGPTQQQLRQGMFCIHICTYQPQLIATLLPNSQVKLTTNTRPPDVWVVQQLQSLHCSVPGHNKSHQSLTTHCMHATLWVKIAYQNNQRIR